MAYTTFPAYAQHLLNGYQLAAAASVARTEMDDGYIQQTPTQSMVRYEVELSYRLDSAARQVAFERWRREDLRAGALYFAWTDVADFTGDTQRRARIVKGEVVYKLLTDRFDEWMVSFKLEYYA